MLSLPLTVRRYWMDLVLESGRDAEISASAANRPKEIWIGVLTGLDLSPVHGHQLCRYEVVAGGAVLLHQAPLSSAERQAGNSYRRATTRRGGKAEALRCLVQIAHQRTCLGTGHVLARVDFDPGHPGRDQSRRRRRTR